MELFIKSAPSCLLCASFIIASAMFGDNICALFPALLPACCSSGDGLGLGDLSSSQGLLDKEPQHFPSAPGRYVQ